MSSDKQAILINIDESPSVDSQLNFQDFPIPSSSYGQPGSSYESGKGPDIIENGESNSKYSIWSLEYFQKFFDVDTDTVVSRIKGSIWPTPGINYLQHYIQSKPDLYGPFWICITLVFTIAISGNLANYLQAAAHHKYHWKYDFHAVSASASAIFLYAWVLPVLLWAVLKVQGAEHFQLSLLELICVYGYSLSIYIPISVLWVIQINWIQWMLVFVGAALSGYVLISSIRPAFGEKNYVYLLVITFLHVLLAVGFKVYFFHVPKMTLDEVVHSAPLPAQVLHTTAIRNGTSN